MAKREDYGGRCIACGHREVWHYAYAASDDIWIENVCKWCATMEQRHPFDERPPPYHAYGALEMSNTDLLLELQSQYYREQE